MTDRQRQLYFAYGSNLSFEQMRARCPAAVPVQALILDGWRLVFRGGADIERDTRCNVAGGLWSLTQACIEVLDHHEHRYDKHMFTLNQALPDHSGFRHEIMTYIRKDTSYYARPREVYVNTIARGYKDFGHARDILDEALGQISVGEEAS